MVNDDAHAWMPEVLNEMRAYAQRHGLQDIAEALSDVRHVALAKLEDSPAGTSHTYPPKQFGSLIDQVARHWERRDIEVFRDHLTVLCTRRDRSMAPKEAADNVLILYPE